VPTLAALRDLNGSGTLQEINERVIEREAFTEEQQAIPHTTGGPRTELEYRLAWARTHLRIAEAVENSSRGVWSLTDVGQSLLAQDDETARKVVRDAVSAYRKVRAADSDDGESDEDEDWTEELLQLLVGLQSDQFERLAARILREAGFTAVTVTGRTGDGGIDGIGVLRVSLLSFQVYFQCKKHKGSVGASAVRDFRGAMAGRGDKGLLITTSSFTAEAQREATRDGATPIDLVDGQALADLLKEFRLGIDVSTRVVEEPTIRREFFAQI